MSCNKCIMEFFIPFVFPDDDSGEACVAACIFVSVTFYNCLDVGHLRLLLISQSEASSSVQ